VQDVAAAAPPGLRDPLVAATTIAELNDWIAAAAMYRWIQAEPRLQRQFLRELADSPRQAALALARTMAARMDPPERDAAWHAADRAGLRWQLALVAACLVVRAGLAGWVAGPWPSMGWHDTAYWLSALVDAPLWSATAPAGVAGIAAGLVVAGWHVLELRWAPAVFERARQYPARVRAVPAPQAWRADTFATLWAAQAAILCAGGVMRAVRAVLEII
jgi:hypothetical protein